MNDWITPTAVTGAAAVLSGAAFAWLKDRRERLVAKTDVDQKRFALDVDANAEFRRIWRHLLAIQNGLFAVVQSIRTDESIALRDGDLSAAKAHRLDAERIEQALLAPSKD